MRICVPLFPEVSCGKLFGAAQKRDQNVFLTTGGYQVVAPMPWNTTSKEAAQLIEAGFQYVCTTPESVMLFKKGK